jgi:hypothetical protein
MHAIGRNDLCPCGSGKKNKKCCGALPLQSGDSTYEHIRRFNGETRLAIAPRKAERSLRMLENCSASAGSKCILIGA